ncbi:hypothetical protein N42_0567 [Lactococcus lactis subsp. lactis]|uniref:Uncharacterized protein n=1 Tax=Lactococcus lactis subsp. lactis TaxID=1360 RepID=A0A0V8EU95_LACLL|nr:hypothetical protein [Lactococcus lactis]KSU29025.1 hypothetical protein N42_0567 [Lactococcus lactis subsp. lactis]
MNDNFPEYAKAGYIVMIEDILHKRLEPILGRQQGVLNFFVSFILL